MDNKTPAFTIEKIPTSSGSRAPDDPLRVEAKASDFLPVRTEVLTSRAIDGKKGTDVCMDRRMDRSECNNRYNDMTDRLTDTCLRC